MWRSTRSPRLSTAIAAALVALAALAPTMSTGTGTAPPPAPVAQYLAEARLAGQGRLDWFGFHVYDARLYVGAPPAEATSGAQDGTRADILRRRFVLELTYARRLRGDAIAQTSREEIERLGFGDETRRDRWLAQMRAIFADVERDTRLAGVHLPGSGARFYRDGRFVGAIDDPEFARAFFSIWLDERTREPGLRNRLLGTGAR